MAHGYHSRLSDLETIFSSNTKHTDTKSPRDITHRHTHTHTHTHTDLSRMSVNSQSIRRRNLTNYSIICKAISTYKGINNLHHYADQYSFNSSPPSVPKLLSNCIPLGH